MEAGGTFLRTAWPLLSPATSPGLLPSPSPLTEFRTPPMNRHSSPPKLRSENCIPWTGVSDRSRKICAHRSSRTKCRFGGCLPPGPAGTALLGTARPGIKHSLTGTQILLPHSAAHIQHLLLPIKENPFSLPSEPPADRCSEPPDCRGPLPLPWAASSQGMPPCKAQVCSLFYVHHQFHVSLASRR